MIIFSVTNIIIADIHWKYFSKRKVITWTLLLLLINPYRIHLSTTLLKDTTIIFFSILAIYKARYSFFAGISLVTLRIASIVYISAMIPVKYWKYLIVPILVLFFQYSEIILETIEGTESLEMHQREFDLIPRFQEYGIAGALIRGITWPLLSITGLFSLISPAFAYIFVAVGCVMNIMYLKATKNNLRQLIIVILPMFIFAILSPSFTAYIRYIYPLIIISPLLLIKSRGT